MKGLNTISDTVKDSRRARRNGSRQASCLSLQADHPSRKVLNMSEMRLHNIAGRRLYLDPLPARGLPRLAAPARDQTLCEMQH